MHRSRTCLLATSYLSRASPSLILNPRIITVIDSNQSRSFAAKKKYSKNPPIDLDKVRTRTLESEDDTNDSKNPSYGLILLAIPILTFGLGCWQLQRRTWKLDLIEFLNKRTTVPPKELPKNGDELAELSETSEFFPFKVKGRFIHSQEILLSPKHDITGTNTQPGGLIITPFVVSDDPNLKILVNRGYVPYTKYSPLKRLEGQIEDEIELVGLLRKNEITSTFTPQNKPPNEWHFRDIDAMARSLGTAPIYLDAIRSSSVPGGPLGGQTAIQLRNEHMSYMITWYTLTVITAFLWWQKFGKLLFLRR